MSGPQSKPWSGNPNAPGIAYDLYFQEKANFSGILIGSILYGLLTMLFFKCMTALFNPTHRKGEGIRWGLVSYTTIMFSFATVFTAMNDNIQSDSYIDNREFPGVEDVLPPGPLGYQALMYSKAVTVIPNLMFLLNNWMADGLLLYRCYVIYFMNPWVIAVPCLMYLSSVGMGITFIYQTSQPNSIALNILLTLMIVIRLVLHSRNVRTAMGLTGIGGLYKAVVTMLIESSALYAVNSMLFIGPWGTGNHAADIFLPILAETQVIAPLLIIQRVANKSALTSRTIVSGRDSFFKARSRGELVGNSCALPSGDPVSSVDQYGVNSGELEVEVKTTIDSHWDIDRA